MDILERLREKRNDTENAKTYGQAGMPDPALQDLQRKFGNHAGEHRTACPWCEKRGDVDNLSVTVNSDHLLYCCHRCDKAGRVKLTASSRNNQRETPATSSLPDADRPTTKCGPTPEQVWKGATAKGAGMHPYLKRKRVGAHGVRVSRDGELLIPIRNIDDELISLQRIYFDGQKLNLPGHPVKGGMFTLGEVLPDGPLILAEGYATAATLHEATEFPTVTAFSAGNLPLVARELRRKYPSAELLIAGDDDHQTKGNPGLAAAQQAAKEADAPFIVPDFDHDDQGTDFNDWIRQKPERVRWRCMEPKNQLRCWVGSALCTPLRDRAAPTAARERPLAVGRGPAQS